jgi:hypothetical protein
MRQKLEANLECQMLRPDTYCWLNASALSLRGKNTRIDLANGSVNMALNLLLT